MKRHYYAIAFVLTLATFVISLAVYPRLSQQVPTHWDIHGKVDDYGSKQWAAFLMPGLMLLMIGLFRLMAWLSPRHFKVDRFRNTYEFVMLLVVMLMGYEHILTLWTGMGWRVDVTRAALGGLFLFLALIGNVLSKVRRNFWVGVRTPWTLASERVWNDTHRLAARVFLLFGILGFVVTMAGAHPAVAIGMILVAALTTVVYSLVDYKKLERRGEV